MEDELLLRHFAECIAFLVDQTGPRGRRVLVHCVYGQSRSAAICVAFLMTTQKLSLLEAYDAVQRARPCIYINSGFLRQLELFERMGANSDELGDTAAHAEYRTMVVCKDWGDARWADIVAVPLLLPPGRGIQCRKCRFMLASTKNQVWNTGR